MNHLVVKAAETALRMGGTAALKVRFLSQMGGLQSFLASIIGARAAAISLGALATACAATQIARMQGKSYDEQEEAAAKAVGRQAAAPLIEWLHRNVSL